MKRPIGKHPLRIALGLLTAMLVILVVTVAQLRSQLDTVQGQLDNVYGRLSVLNNDVQGNFAEERAVADPLNEVVYIPEFRIKLPYNDRTKALAYSMRTSMVDSNGVPRPNPEADVTSTMYRPPQEMTRINCSNLVRLKVEDKQHPYSPHEKPTTVALSDGRQLQVYESVNEPECAQSWSWQVDPTVLTNEFKKAEAY